MTLSTEDRLDIVDVVTRADAAATARNVEDYLACFTDDARLVGAKGEHNGKGQLRRSLGAIWASEGATTAHLSLNVVVDEVDNTKAVVRSILLIVESGPPVTLLGLSAITQNVVKKGGHWRIELRNVRELTSTSH
ncbi:MAG TPA: nuclear transport factor 2 family protein [Acidimicrobiales bacterium]|nr:nuclear transport factor 2 family protein [Acidimicrobiales bacterium]